jgi:hypothetical protein
MTSTVPRSTEGARVRWSSIGDRRGRRERRPDGAKRHGHRHQLTLDGLLSFAGAVLALRLVREREIERQPVQAAGRARAEVRPPRRRSPIPEAYAVTRILEAMSSRSG